MEMTSWLWGTEGKERVESLGQGEAEDWPP